MGCVQLRFRWWCLKFLGGAFWALSLLGLVSSIVLVGWAYQLTVDVGDHLELAMPREGYLWPASLGLTLALVAPTHALGVGLRGSLARDFASRRAFRRNTGNGRTSLDRLLCLHVALSCVSGLLALGACAGGAFYWSLARRRLRQGLHRVIRRYPNDAAAKPRLDQLQIELRCCGVDSYADWFRLPWTRARGELYLRDASIADHISIDGGEKHVSTDVPFSCCSAEARRACVHQGIATPEARASATISRRGCVSALLARADEAGRDVVACLLLISVYQLTLSILSRLLQTARRSAIQAGVQAERFAAWIFGCGPPSQSPCSPQPRTTEIQQLIWPEVVCGSTSPSTPTNENRRPIGRFVGGADQRGQDSTNSDEKSSRSPTTREDDIKGNRKLNSTDFYGRFRGTLQDTLERRQTRQSSAVGKWRALRQLQGGVNESSASSSSLPSLPSLPTTPPRAATQCCPVHPRMSAHRCCPVHGDIRRSCHKDVR